MADDAVQPDAPVVQSAPTMLDGDRSQMGPVAAAPAAQPAPAATTDVAPPSSIAPVPTPDYQAPPVVLQPVKRSGIGGIVDELRDALAPQTQQKVAVDGQGNKYIQTTDLTGGQKWAKIAGDAVRGAAAGYAAGRGAGNGANAAQAGINAQDQQQEKQQQQNQQQNAEVRQATLDKFNFVQLQQQAAATAFHLTAENVQATRDMVDFSQKQDDRYKTLGYADMGVHASPGDLADTHGDTPDFWKDVYAQHIVQNPEYDENGKPVGIHLWKAVPGLGSQLAPKDTQVAFYVGPQKPGDTGHIEYHTPTVEMTNDSVTAYNTAAQKQMQDATLAAHKDAHEQAQTAEANANASKVPSEIKKNNAEAGNQNAEALKARTEAKVAGQSLNDSDNSPVSQRAARLVEGDDDVSLLSKRSKDYDAIKNAADAYSMQKYGKPFNVEEAAAKYQAKKKTITAYASGTQGDQIQSFNTFMGHADNLSNSVNTLRNANSPLINVPVNKLRKMEGDPTVAAILPQIDAVRTEYKNFLNNNHALHEDDIAEGKSMLNENMSLAQQQAAIKSFTGVALTRVGTLNDRYKRVVGGDVPELLNDTSKTAIQNLGLGEHARVALGMNSPVQLQPNEVPMVNPKTNQQIVPRGNKWVDVKTGQPVVQ